MASSSYCSGHEVGLGVEGRSDRFHLWMRLQRHRALLFNDRFACDGKSLSLAEAGKAGAEA